jgi:hypothetical protein
MLNWNDEIQISKQYALDFFWFVRTDDYKQWSNGVPKEVNAMAYLDFVKERDHATRLEF